MKLAMIRLLCLLSSAAESAKLGSEKPSAAFLQQLSEASITSHHRLLLEQVQNVASQNERGKEFKDRMESYATMQDQILHFATQENVPPHGSDVYKFVTEVQQLVDKTMKHAIIEQFKADTEVTERAHASFQQCDLDLRKTLVKVDPIRDGGVGADGEDHPGLKRTAVEHLTCRTRQNEQKLVYDKCIDVLDLLEEQRNASCINFTTRYKNPGAYSTGAWSDSCISRQTPYRTEEPDQILGLDLGPVDVEGYLMEMFDYFTNKERDYVYAKELCENRTRLVKEKQTECESEFSKHGEISDECDDMQRDLDQNSCEQATDRHDACLEYDRCYVKSEEDENFKGHEYCGDHGQEVMLQLEADTLIKIDCLLDALKDQEFPGRRAKVEGCLNATHPRPKNALCGKGQCASPTGQCFLVDGVDYCLDDSGNCTKNCDIEARISIPDSLTFRLCRLRHPARFSDDSKECGSYRSPMNDEDMSGTFPYVVKYFRGPNFWPLKGSPDDTTDDNNAPPTNLAKCKSQCCKRPPPDPKIPDSHNHLVPFGVDLAVVKATPMEPLKSVFLPSGRLNVEALPKELEDQVVKDSIFHHMPKCGYCGSYHPAGHEEMIYCAYCIGSCCDPPGVTDCVNKHPGEAKTCENKEKDGTVALLAMQKPQVSLASMATFKSSVSQTKHGSGKWRAIMARTRRKNQARMRRAEAELA